MNRQRKGISAGRQGYRKQLLHTMGHYLPHRGLPLQTTDGRVRWSDRLLAMTAVLMVWSATTAALDAFQEARETVVSMYVTRRRPGRCLSGFLTCLRTSTARSLEVCSRSLKQAMGNRRMLSTSARNARAELDWAVVGLWLLSLTGVAQVASADRRRLSVARALRVVRHRMRSPDARPPAGGIGRTLSKALVDRYARTSSKKALDWPHRKREKPPGVPKIRMATKAEVLKAQKIRCKVRAA